MANIKISELNELLEGDRAYDDYLPIVDSSANETKKVSVKNLIPNNVELIAVTDTAPTSFGTGDKYYNTTTNRIYTARSGEWISPEEPIKGILYVILEDQKTFTYDEYNETLVSVGSVSGSVVNNYSTSTTEGYSCNYINNTIVNDYSTSQENAYSCDCVNNMMNYSTTEVNTGNKWIDGKPIYRKVINFGALPDTSTKAVAHNISNLDTIIDYKALAKSINAILPIPYMALTASYGIYMYFDATNITVETGYNRSAYSMYVVLEYTKTTD